MTDDNKPALTQAERLKNEPLDRIIGRLGDDQKQALAFAYAERAVRVVAPAVLQGKGAGSTVAGLGAVPPVKDAASAALARDALQNLHKAADAARLKEEAAAGGLTDGPATHAASALSFTVEAVKASLGEGGLKVSVQGGNVQQGPKAITNLSAPPRALVTARYILAMCNALGPEHHAAEELQLKTEAQAILKSRRVI